MRTERWRTGNLNTGDHENCTPDLTSLGLPDPAWLADDAYAVLEEKGVRAATAEARPFTA